MNVTSIEWCDFSANPLKYRDAAGKAVWACVHHSPGCQHCYAETLAKRYGRGGPFNVQTAAQVTPFLDDKELRQMLTAKRIGGKDVSGSRVFVGDMTDIFGEWVPDALLDRLFAVFAQRADVIWQVLTKRAARLHDYMRGRDWGEAANRLENRGVHLGGEIVPPLPNVWLGVSAEDQPRADERITFLLRTPAAVRFVSAEPLIGPIDLTHVREPGYDRDALDVNRWQPPWTPDAKIDWLIVGGESGPGARPMNVAWARMLVRQCAEAGVACFLKQLGSHVIDRNDAGFEGDPGDSWTPQTKHDELTPQGWQGDPVRIRLTSRKGGDMAEWPADLRVREWPLSRGRTR